MDEHRCPGCIRPVCQRKITLKGCREKKVEDVTGVPLNDYGMHDLFSGG